jgi:hypothetical protein
MRTRSNRLRFVSAVGLGLIGLVASFGTVKAGAAKARAGATIELPQERARRAYANLPVAFIENRGQTDARVRYYAQGDRYAFYLTSSELVMAFDNASDARERAGRMLGERASSASPASTAPTVLNTSPTLNSSGRMNASAAPNASIEMTGGGHAVALRFIGANRAVVPAGEAAMPGEVNYLRGSSASTWQTSLHRYARVGYPELWPGVDLQVFEHGGVLKYEFHVRPGASPAAIQLAYAGADSLSLDATGGLRIATDMGALRDAAPVSYQMIDGARVPVDSRYALLDAATESHDASTATAGRAASAATATSATAVAAGAAAVERRFGFDVGTYRRDRELVIDPGVEYSTLLGGASHDTIASILVDALGNAYLAGTTQSPDFPTTPGAYKRTGATSNFSDVFVSKLNATGTALIYSTFIGGSSFDWGRRLAVDAAGNAYVAGQTQSSNFPTTSNAFDRSINIGACPRCGVDPYDAFVTKLNASGSALVYSTYLGGIDIDGARGIAVDSTGAAYVTGETTSADFPTTAGAFNRTNRTNYDIFVTKLNPAGSALVYSTFLGGTAADNGERIAVDGNRNAYVLGFSSSADFPTTAGAFDTTANGGFDVVLSKLNAAGSALVYSTFIGGSDFDSGGALVIDGAGRAYVGGGSGSLDFPTTPGVFDATPDGNDAYLLALDPAGSSLVFSTMFGGAGSASATGLAVDVDGSIWVGGGTTSTDFPVTAGAVRSTLNGFADAFVAHFSPGGTSVLYGTYVGGNQSDSALDLALDMSGDVYIAGQTYSPDFPTTAGALDRVFNGDPLVFWGDSFVLKLNVEGTTPPPTTPPPTTPPPTTPPPTTPPPTTPPPTTPPPTTPPPAQTATLTVTASGRKSVRVTSAPAGINVSTGSTGSASFTTGTSITLTPSDGRDAIFSGACSSGVSKRKSCTFTFTGAASVSVNVQ